MSDNMQLVTRVNEFQSIAKTFVESGLFSDVRSQAQAFVKIMAGAEMGIPPFTAMNSFHIIQGKACMSANAIAARVKASGRYDYRIVEKSATRCVIEFSERSKPGTLTETWDEARARKMGVKNMDKMPDAMLFARCITAGARAFCPDVVGQYYTPEEMGAEIDENGEIVDAPARVVQQRPAPDPVVAAAAQNGGVVRTASMGADVTQTPRDEAIDAWKAAAREAKGLGLDAAIESNKVMKSDGAEDVWNRAANIVKAIDGYRAFEQATTLAAGEQAVPA
jgi:hypothetical protein